MDWYVVIKVINSRPYVYRQRTFRDGGRVKTECEYVGPSAGEPLPHELAELAQLARDAPTLPEFLVLARGKPAAFGMSDRRLAALYWQSVRRAPSPLVTTGPPRARRRGRGERRAGQGRNGRGDP